MVLKKIIILGLLMIIACVSVKAQSYYLEDDRTFHGAIYAGGNFTQIDGDNFKGLRKKGINAGGAVYVFLNKEVGVSMEILYSEKGCRTVPRELGLIDNYAVKEYKINLNYTEVPILLHYFFPEKSHIGGGLSLGRIITSTQVIKADPNLDVFSEGYFKDYDLSFIVNSNLRLYKGLFLNTRFQYSVMSIAKKEIAQQSPVFGRVQQSNHVWTFRLMYFFGLD